MSRPLAAIDIGSNSLLLTVTDAAGEVVVDEARVVGLGAGLADGGTFRPDRVAAALEVLEAYSARAAALGVPPEQVAVAATSAARRALDIDTFIEAVARRTGLQLRVIPGVEEARLTFLGARLGLEVPAGPLAVVDLGGGSTEVAIGSGGRIEGRVSLETGTVRATERFLGVDYLEGRQDHAAPGGLRALRDHVAEIAHGAFPLRPQCLIAVAGTATTLAAMELGLESWDSARVHGTNLRHATLSGWIAALGVASLTERQRLVAVSPERANTMLAGACILEAILVESHRSSMLISIGGLRHGLLADGPMSPSPSIV